MNESGLTVYVEMSPRSILTRMRTSKKKRPLLMQIPPDEREQYIRDHLAERRKFYSQAKLTIKGENADIEEISHSIQSNFM